MIAKQASTSKLKILAIHNAYHEDQTKRPATDAWRIARPLEELAKHTDWQIDHRAALIPNMEQYKDRKDFTEAEMELAFKDVSSYDIVFSSYQANPTMYTLLKVAADKTGTQYIMDVDDDMFAINPDNPVWTKLSDRDVFMMQRMIADNSWLCATTEELANVFRERRKGHHKSSVYVVPNYISDAYQAPPPAGIGNIVMGFFGGSSHYADIHESGFLPAVQKIMHEHKNVYFKSIGMPIDYYLPKTRTVVVDPQRGDGWLNNVYPNMQLDIACAPLLDNIFNKGKSDIKWQEATRAGSLFVCSNIGPYKRLSPDTAYFCANTETDWYRVLSKAVEDSEQRRKTVSNAQFALDVSYRLENNWEKYRDMFLEVARVGKSG